MTLPRMGVAVGLRVQPKRYIITGLSVLAAAVMSGAPGHAATNSVVPCDQVGRNLQSLDVPVNTLPLDVVDHAPLDTADLDEPRVESESAAPILDLTPRVKNILRDVFDMSDEELAEDTPPLPSSSPLADSDEASDEAEPIEVEVERGDLPRFQQQMYRTDI